MKNIQHRFGLLFFFLLGFGVFAQTSEETIIDVMSKNGTIAQSPESCACRPTYSNYSQTEVDALNAINAHRQSIGLSQLTLINHISNNCLDHCNYMIANNVASHDYFTVRADNIMCALNSSSVGEIVAYNYSSGYSVVNAWLQSAGHKAVIEGPLYTGFGISVRANSNGNKYYTCMFTRQPSGSCSTIPTIIPFACENSLSINSQVTTGVDKKQAVTSIEARNIINIGAGAIYHAGSTVVLKSSFNAKAGSTFHAYIAGCTGTFIARESGQNDDGIEKDSFKEQFNTTGITLYPNPANDKITIRSDTDVLNSIRIIGLDGKVMIEKQIKNLSSVEIEIDSLQKGLYIIEIETNENQKELKKLIKN
jgi:uncharacterized protein YkwD